MSTRPVYAAIEIVDELNSFIRRPCSPADLSTSPGSYIPVLRYILEEYTLAHREAEATSALVAMARG
ncbi:hypothetical protein DFQ30_005425, partial [Apophysomyces sp. BC1015]